jgi:hypothetical protein
VEKIGQYVVARPGKYRLGMYLRALDYIFFVSYAHYFSLSGAGCNRETGRQCLWFDDQRMITGCREWIVYAFVNSLGIMADKRGLTVDR